MNTKTIENKAVISIDDIHAIFDKLSMQLDEDRKAMVTGTASDEKTSFFEMILKEDTTKLNTFIRTKSTSIVIGGIIGDYLNGLQKLGKKPITLAFQFGFSIGNVWVEVEDGDDEFIHSLILLEAEINSKYRQNLGYTLCSMIIEKSDSISMPSDYQIFPLKK